MPTVFILDEAFREKLANLRSFAEKSEHWYRPELKGPPPGDNKSYIVTSGTVRMVFTWTRMSDNRMYRHLSISSYGSYPSPVVVWTVDHMLGFTGATPDQDGFVHDMGKDWHISSEDTGTYEAIVLAEEITQ